MSNISTKEQEYIERLCDLLDADEVATVDYEKIISNMIMQTLKEKK